MESKSYTLILAAKPGVGPSPGSEGWDPYAAEYMAFTEEIAAAGVLRGGESVHPPDTATTVRVSDGQVKLHDGPFAELDEQVIGWYLIEVDNLDDAVTWAAKVPVAARGYGAVEVRANVDHSQGAS